MQVTVKLIGTLADRLPANHPLGNNPRATHELDLATDASVAALLEHIGLSVESEYFAMINEQHVPSTELVERTLREGDAVVLVPPMKGG